MGRKATNVQSHARTNEVYSLLVNGHSKTEIVQHCSKNYGIGLRQAEGYITKARRLQVQDADLERPTWLISAVSRLGNYEKLAANKQNYSVALKAVELQARLLRFDLS